MTAPVIDLSQQVEDMLTEMGRDLAARMENSSYYEAEKRPETLGLAVPPAMRHLLAKIGWARTYLDSLEERLDIEGFRMGSDAEADKRLWQWWQANNMDVASGLAHTEAMIHGRCYITVAAPDSSDPLSNPKTPVIKVESPESMYAQIDPRTGRVTRAIRYYTDPDKPAEDRATLYLPNVTYLMVKGSGPSRSRGSWVVERTIQHNLGVVPVIPILNKKRIDQCKGVSEIFPELRSHTDAASRLMMNMSATAELMAIPQRAIFGVSRDELVEQTATGTQWEAYIANILAFSDPEGKMIQLAAAELRNFGDGMTELSKLVAGDTGLPPQYLAFSSDNPASADAIRASESRLVKKAERKCRIFGEAWEQVMRVALLVMDKEIPTKAFEMETIWRDPATPTYAAKADAVVKLATATTADGRSVLPVEQARRDMNYSQVQLDQMDAWDKQSTRSQLAQLLAKPAEPQFSDGSTPETKPNPEPQE